MRRAVFGGSFDPPHHGHLAMLSAVRERGLADHVWLVPAGRNPHKPAAQAPPAHRLRMAELACAGLPGVEVLALETSRPGPSYTVDTLEELARRHPGDELLLLLGADSLSDLPRWRRPERIVELAELLVFPRPGRPLAVPAGLAPRLTVIDGFAVDISSTRVRAELAAGRRPVDLVPAAVLAHIAAHRLYGAAAPAGGGKKP